ncbi:PAQR family membrane homeostasis protein TrhA [Alkalisalibacterium limincola]|uniref:Hemolysin III family protein n=1 Tax=Alkalisalibacterium limincola TaxID=2699169 RepID=A0A5C8KSF8_9GAMM|nr:hemolysin III family protein [Alkalisalibacterium limincola]TXK62644.1 hemolysin III family protein [Alkalisalibacterium limincola]
MSRADELREEVVNALTHGLGAVIALAAGAVLITLAAVFGDGWQLAGAIVFGATLLLLYLASTLYHAIPHPIAKQRLKVFDHCAIYLLIAGTYTPFTLIGLRDDGGWLLFGVIWALAAMGIAFKLFFTGRFKLVSTLIYVAMGWIALLAIGPMLRQLPPTTLAWLFAGGVAYTVGAVFYMSRRLRYGHAIWHLFVIAGSVCHFVAVATQVLSPDYS